MGCRCNERGVAIARALKAAGAGDRKMVVDQTRFVVRSAAQDAKAVFARSIAAARQSLARR